MRRRARGPYSARLTRFGPRPSRFAALQTALDPIPRVAKPCCNRLWRKSLSLGAGQCDDAISFRELLLLRPGRSLQARSQQRARDASAYLIGWSKNNPELRDCVASFADELARLGWIDGRNAQIEERWTNSDGERARAFATELVAWRPDVLLSSTTPATAAVHRETSTIPIVLLS